MLSGLTIVPLTRALKWLVWLTIVLVLLIGSIAKFYYTESQTNTARAEVWNRIQQDTLSKDLSKKAISVANLLANPKKYHNQSIWVKGYLNIEFEGDAIYWHQKAYKTHQYRKSFYVQFSDSLYQVKPIAAYSQHYVILKGIFNANNDLRPGSIQAIESINVYQ